MREALTSIITLALLATVILFVVTLAKPSLKLNKTILKSSNRKRLAVYYSLGILTLFTLIGILAPPQVIRNDAVSTLEGVPAATQSQVEESSELDALNTTENEQEVNQPKLYTVTKVIDGDTIEVDMNGKVEKLRLIGIDTPETVDPRKPVQCFGNEASNRAKELLQGKKVSLESDPSQEDRDKYGRLLRYVYLEDGTSYNKQIISDGYAHEYTYNIPYKYQSEYKQAQKDAETSQRGLWSPNTCNGDTEQSVSTAPQPQTSQPATQPQAGPQTSSNCDPNYSPCIPNVASDLDCGDISIRVQVIGVDRHRFDGDSDGIGCESY